MKDKNMGLSNVLVNFIEDLEESDPILFANVLGTIYGWYYYKKQIKAPANIKAVKIGAKAEKRNVDPDTAFIDGFKIYVEGRYLVAKCSHPLLQRVMITSEDGSTVYYDSNAY